MYSETSKDKKSSKHAHKPDKTCHYKDEEGTMAKKATLPGQMYVPKKVHNESDFAGEEYQCAALGGVVVRAQPRGHLLIQDHIVDIDDMIYDMMQNGLMMSAN